MNDEQGRQEMLGLGAVRVPVLRMGDRWIYAYVLDDIAKFLGIERDGAANAITRRSSTPKMDRLLAFAQSYLRAFPPDQLHLSLPGRKRDVYGLSCHLFTVPYDLIALKEGDTFGLRPVPEWVRTAEDVATFGNEVRREMRGWFKAGKPMLRMESIGDDDIRYQIRPPLF